MLARIPRALSRRADGVRAYWRRRALGREPLLREVTPERWPESLEDPNAMYLEAVRFFDQRLPQCFTAHRRYFSARRRGFGEDAFHSMWYWLFDAYRFSAFLEIGVYRGQTLSLVSLLQRHFGVPGMVVGVSPFTPAGDHASRYRDDVDYLADTLANFAHFDLTAPRLVRTYSTDPSAVEVFSEQAWDCIYIDGSHDYEVVKVDWENSARSVACGGLIVMDDSALYTRFEPPLSRFKGHPGPSRVADEVGMGFVERLRVGHNRVFQRVG